MFFKFLGKTKVRSLFYGSHTHSSRGTKSSEVELTRSTEDDSVGTKEWQYGSTRALGNKSGSFCEAVNCERSEQEGKFLFAMLVSIRWFPPPSKASWYNARESAESCGTIHLEK